MFTNHRPVPILILMDRYKYILFDWDGCLAKTLQIWLSIFQEELGLRGIQASDASIASKLGHRDLGEFFGVKDEAVFIKTSVQKANQRVMEVELYEGASSLLADLQKIGKVMGLVSSSPRQALINGVEHNSLQSIFQTIVSGDHVTKYKPDPEPLQVASTAIGGIKRSTVMIGDTANDILAAKAFGIDSILVFPDEHNIFYDKEKFLGTKPTHVVNSLFELKNIL